MHSCKGYAYPKWPERTEISRVLMGRGLLWADGMHVCFLPFDHGTHSISGDIHKRQRKAMLPGFGGEFSISQLARRVF